MKTLKDRSRKNTVEAREAEQGKRPAGFIDLTPTWSGVLARELRDFLNRHYPAEDQMAGYVRGQTVGERLRRGA